MLRVSDNQNDSSNPSNMSIDKKKRQVTLSEPSSGTTTAAATQERGPMVAAPKMFAFDNLFTNEDSQVSSFLYKKLPTYLISLLVVL